MAIRYSGPLTIRVLYTDRGDYKVGVSGPDGRWSGRVRPAPAGFGSGIAYDSEKAYDEIAESALAFADDEKRGIAEQAEMDDEGYKIRRVKDYWKKYPGGQHKPKRLRDPATQRANRARHVWRARGFKESTPKQAELGEKAKDYVARGTTAEKQGHFSSAAVWFAKAGAAYERLGSKARARMWKRRAKDVKHKREMRTLYRGDDRGMGKKIYPRRRRSR